MLRFAGLALIGAYQRYLSPRKGFRCAYGVLHGGGTCSSIGKRLLREQGMVSFFKGMRVQFTACRLAAQQLSEQLQDPNKRKKNQPYNLEQPGYCPGGSSCDGPFDCYDFPFGACDDAGTDIFTD